MEESYPGNKKGDIILSFVDSIIKDTQPIVTTDDVFNTMKWQSGDIDLGDPPPFRPFRLENKGGVSQLPFLAQNTLYNFFRLRRAEKHPIFFDLQKNFACGGLKNT